MSRRPRQWRTNAPGFYGSGVVGPQNSFGSGAVGKSTGGNWCSGTTTATWKQIQVA
jgi:hypothetical protein